MDLVIRLDRTTPPAGELRTPTGAVPFEGWLSLLAALERATGSPAVGLAAAPPDARLTPDAAGEGAP